MNYETTAEMEMAVSYYFGTRRNLIVPNVSWGMFLYEMDLVVLRRDSLYAGEVEIKVSRSDLKRDQKKNHCHDRNRNMIKCLWFAVPEKLSNCLEFVPERAGFLTVASGGRVVVVRKPLANPLARKWSVEDALKLTRLGLLRYWDMKNYMLRNKAAGND